MRSLRRPEERRGPKKPDLRAEAHPGLGPVLDFLRALWAVDHALQRTSKRMSSTIGVTGPQRLTLRIVDRFPGIAAGQLAGILHLHPSTITGVLKRLEAQGLIVRRADRGDRRRTLVDLTAKGRRLAGTAQGTVENVVARVLEDSEGRQVASARALLDRLATALEDAAKRKRS